MKNIFKGRVCCNHVQNHISFTMFNFSFSLLTRHVVLVYLHMYYTLHFFFTFLVHIKKQTNKETNSFIFGIVFFKIVSAMNKHFSPPLYWRLSRSLTVHVWIPQKISGKHFLSQILEMQKHYNLFTVSDTLATDFWLNPPVSWEYWHQFLVSAKNKKNIDGHSCARNSTSTSDCKLALNLSVGGPWVHAKTAHEGNVARPGGRSQLVGWSVRAGSRTITAVTYHHSVWLRQWHSRTPQGKNEAFIQLVSQDQAGHARNDKTICWAQ